MSQSDNIRFQDAGLNDDADFKTALKRVSYQPGMLLGLNATQAEQDYHRRRFNRHNYWLHGSGTVAGLRVVAKGRDPGNDTTHSRVQLHITPGIGVDGLGRDVTVHEPYCIDLGAWLTARYNDEENNGWGALIRDGFDAVNNLLWLKITMRFQENVSGLQPVMATDINAGTDPVMPSRLQDGVLFELTAERPPQSDAPSQPFAAHAPLPQWNDEFAAKLTDAERDQIGAATGNAQEQLQLAARLLYALPDDSEALATREFFTVQAAELARTLLARIAIRLNPGPELIINPRRVAVDNLARTFLLNAATLTHLIK